MSLELIAMVVVAMIALAIYASMHKATETKLMASLAAVNAFLIQHSTALNDIEGLLTAHGLTLGVLEDKAQNVLTDIEKSKAIQEIEAAITKAKSLFADTAATADPAPAVAPAAAPVLQTFNVDPATGLPLKAAAQ